MNFETQHHDSDRQVEETLRALSAVQAPLGLTERISQRLDQERLAQPQMRRRTSWWSFHALIHNPAVGFATVLVLLGGAFGGYSAYRSAHASSGPVLARPDGLRPLAPADGLKPAGAIRVPITAVEPAAAPASQAAPVTKTAKKPSPKKKVAKPAPAPQQDSTNK